MPYTLAKFFLWGLLMAVTGGVIGWMLRSLKSRAQVAGARAATVDRGEVERLRRRLANLEPVVAERDRLRMELADVRGISAGALGFATTTRESIIPDEPVVGEPSVAEPFVAETPAQRAADVDEAPEALPDTAVLDLSAAASVLGRAVALDDLTVVEGIGPKISELCHALGITTWRGLADTDVEVLQSMLHDAGSRFQMHKPESWPRQAALLARGEWAEFTAVADELDGG